MSTLEPLKGRRFEKNPNEKVFYELFEKEHTNNFHMDFMVFGQKPDSNMPNDFLDDREKQIVLSVIQWLGSPVGDGFLCKAQDEINKLNR